MSSATLSSRVAVITGGGSGIGFALAQRLAEQGWSLVLAGRSADRIAGARARLVDSGAAPAERVHAVTADVSDPSQAFRPVDLAIEAFGRLDALVNNAGLAKVLPIDKSTPREVEAIFAANALGPAYTIHRAWPHFRAQKSGCIVNISTKGTVDPFPGFFAYAASKAAVNLFALSAAKEGRSFGVRAFAVAPGAVETGMLRSMFSEKSLPADLCLSPNEVAQVVHDCIEGRRDDDNGRTIFVRRTIAGGPVQVEVH